MSKRIRRKDFLKLAGGGLISFALGKKLTDAEPKNSGFKFQPVISPAEGNVKEKLRPKEQPLSSPSTQNYREKFSKENFQAFPVRTKLGKTEISVSTVGFGVSRTMEPALVLAVMEAGVNFMDTGRSYFRGQNEAMLGRTLERRRPEAVIQSKLRVNLNPEQIESNEEIKRALEEMEKSLQESLKALRTDYIDILLIHGAEHSKVIDHTEIMNFFERKKEQGIIRAHGFSSHQNQVELLRAENEVCFYDVIMTTYNHKGAYVHMNTGRQSSWDQEALEKEMLQARKRGVGLVAMKTCSAGPLTTNPEERPTYVEALRWVLRKNVVHTMAVAMASFEQIKENLQVWK